MDTTIVQRIESDPAPFVFAAVDTIIGAVAGFYITKHWAGALIGGVVGMMLPPVVAIPVGIAGIVVYK